MSRPIPVNNPLPTGRLALFVALLFCSLSSVRLSAQCTLVCNQNISVSLDDSGQAMITPAMILAGACSDVLDIKLYTAQGVPLANPLTCTNIDKTITAKVRHVASGNNCSGTLKVRDALPPVLSCPEEIVLCGQDDSPEGVGQAIATDNCTSSIGIYYQHLDVETDLGCSGNHAGYPVIRRIDRQWLVSDAAGNSSSCVQQIWTRRPTIADVVFPANRDGVAMPPLNCGQNPDDLNLTGQPMVDGKPISNNSLCELGVAHTDQIINYCPPAGYSVLRTWIIIEFCNSNVTQRQQLIQIKDLTPPVIVPPATFTIGTLNNQCVGTVTLPNAIASDDCSSVTIAPVWAFGNGYGPFANVPLGTYTVTYIATDACGNTAAATSFVNVVDNSPPTVLCTNSLQLSLGNDGMSYLQASALDVGSYDQCGDVTLDVSRDEVTYAPSLVLSCADLGEPVSVTLRVTDMVGLENFCVANVIVRDLLKPALTCPAHLTINCQQDYNNLQLTGAAQATDNCTLQSLDSTNTVAINACHIGTVTRSWKATDTAGNIRTCAQIITLAPINTTTVTFPADKVVNSCASADAIAPAATGQPVLGGQSCYQLSVTYTDQIFQGVPPSCYRIARTWKVIDFCINTLNGGSSGIWQKTQLIDVKDNNGPILNIPADITVAVNQPNCLAQINVTDATATDCSSTITISHNSTYAASGANASGSYPVGNHSIIFQATDGCGNVSQQTMHIVVQDLTAPVAVCTSGLAVNIGTDSLAVVNPALLGTGSNDLCSPSLTFSASPTVFSCQQIGYQTITLTVTDAAGNSASCSTLINVQDSTGNCGGATHKVDGIIRTPTGQRVAEISMRLSGSGYAEITDCDSLGHFTFSDIPTGSYQLKPENNAKWLNGVTTFDLLLISRHILGIQPLTTPYKMLAADANHSGSITAFDIIQLRKVILGLIDTIPASTSWRFMPSNFVFTDTLNPFVNPPPEYIMLNGLHNDQADQNFIGIKVGDLNGNANFADPRSPLDTAWVELPDLMLHAGVPVDVPLRLKNWSALSGFQFEIDLPTEVAELDSVRIAAPRLLNSSHIAQRNDHSLAISWDDGQQQPELEDSVLVILHLLPKQTIHLRAIVQLQRENVAPESYPANQESIAPLGLRFHSSESAAETISATMQVFPNPFSDVTTLAFDLPEAGEVQLSVTDARGIPVLSRQANFAKGQQQWRIQGTELPGPGVYYCRLVSATRTFSASAGLIFGQ